MTAKPETKIIVKSCDGKSFELSKEVVELLKTIKGLMTTEDGSYKPGGTISLKEVDGTMLAKVIQWADYHKDDPSILNETYFNEQKKIGVTSDWDEQFLSESNIYELIYCATQVIARFSF